MTTEELETVFLRHTTEDGGEAELSEGLKTETARLTESVGAWSRRLGGLPHPRHPSRVVSECDRAISDALRAVEAAEYADAFASLRRARAALEQIQAAWEANRAYEAALAEYENLKGFAASNRLVSLLTFVDIARLLEQSLAFIGRGRYRQAELLARACAHRCESLGGRQADVPRESHLSLERLSILCDEVARFLPHGRPDWADKSALRDVERLLAEGRGALAERLMEDLEVELTPHSTFLHAYRQFGSELRAPDDELRELIAAESWSAATSRLLGEVLGEVSEGLIGMPARAAGIVREIDGTRPRASG